MLGNPGSGSGAGVESIESNPDSEVGVFAGEGPERDLLALLRNDVIPTERPAKTRGSVFLPWDEETAAAAHLS